MKKNKATGFIRWQKRSKKPDAPEYGIYCPSCHGYSEKEKRERKDIWLGTVIDKEKGVFYSRKKGLFGFTVDAGYYQLTPFDIELYQKFMRIKFGNKQESKSKIHNEQSISIRFGDTFVLNEYLKNSGLLQLFKTVDDKADTLLTLILFRILTNRSYYHAYQWWHNSYAKILYPKALVSSENISAFLVKLGDESYFRRYIIEHMKFIKHLTPKCCILIDSTGLPNDLKVLVKALSNHNGNASNEDRLVFVIEKNSSCPIYYRYVSGNVLDASTLNMIVNELKEYDIKLDKAILDAGYSEKILLQLFKNDVPFITRMDGKVSAFKHILEKYEPSLKSPKNYILYKNNHFYVKKIPLSLYNDKLKAYAYLCLDIEKEGDDEKRYHDKYKIQSMDKSQYLNHKRKFGIFVLLSSSNIKTQNILSCYAYKDSIEQIFDYLINEFKIIPDGVQSEAAYRGHLLVSFMALTAFIDLQNVLRKNNLQIHSSIYELIDYQCRVFPDRLVPNVATKSVNDICKALDIKIPSEILLK
ncbi:MAG: transposase [Deltaproteobacteria bacterium]|nr:transposase [Deltaproteobacteria bacterium]